jgi:SecD/SecF fusion protein
MFVRGFNFGVEFTGGRVVEFATTQEVSVNDARTRSRRRASRPRWCSRATTPTSRSAPPRSTTTRSSRSAADIAAVAGDATISSDNLIGPTLGSELRTKALIALGIALLAQLAYLAVRFRWTFAAATVLAMLHDVLIVVGLFTWLGKPIDGVFLAAALTIIGVSVNDSVVTMDRIRETWAANRNRPLRQVVNEAVIATMPRTINTGLGAFFILGALTVLGGRSLTDFALALLIGLFVGTYSSAFVASPLLLLLEKRNSAPPPMPKRKAAPTTSRRRPQGGRASVPRPVGVSREGGVV